MRKKLVLGLALLNAVFALAFFAPPASTQEVVAAAFQDCCEGSGEEAFCCSACCWFTHDCFTNGDCNL